MIAVFVIAGVVYVYLTDRNNQQIATKAPSVPEEQALPKPVAPNPNAPEGVAIETLVSPVKAGENSSVNIRTNAGSACTILVTYNNVPAKDSGLAPQNSNPYGFVQWTWTVDPAAPVGTWPVKITCVFNGRSGVVDGNLQITH